MIRKIIVISVSVVLVLFIIHTIAVYITNKEVENELQKYKNAGIPTSFSELLSQNPDRNLKPEENAAILFKKLDEMEMWLPKNNDKKYDPESDMQNIIESFVKSKDAKSRKIIEEIVDKNKNVVDMFYKISKCKGSCFIASPTEDPLWLWFPSLTKIRNAFIIFAANIIIKNDNRQRINDLKTYIKFVDFLASKQPYLLQTIPAIASSEMFLSVIETLRINNNINQDEFFELTKTFDEFEKTIKEKLIISPIVEECIFQQYFDPSIGKKSETREFKKHYEYSYLWRPALNKDHTFYLRNLFDMIALAKNNGWDEKKSKEINANIKASPFYNLLSMIITPNFTKWIKIANETFNTIRIAKITFMVEYYKSIKGKYPVTLNDLQKELGLEIPKDTMNGSDFMYKPEVNKFNLSSIN